MHSPDVCHPPIPACYQQKPHSLDILFLHCHMERIIWPVRKISKNVNLVTSPSLTELTPSLHNHVFFDFTVWKPFCLSCEELQKNAVSYCIALCQLSKRLWALNGRLLVELCANILVLMATTSLPVSQQEGKDLLSGLGPAATIPLKQSGR